jgi:hypothetical protein
MTSDEMEKLSKGISNDMSAKAIMKRLYIVHDLYEAAKRMSDFHKINGKFGKVLPELHL